MRKFSDVLTMLVIFVCMSAVAKAQEDNKNISISKKTATYEFVKGNAEYPVLIKERFATTYKCNGYRTAIPYAEFYDDKSTIDEVRIYTDGSRNKDIVPLYKYYSVDDYFYSDEHICYFSLPLEKKNSESRVEVEKTISNPRYFTTIYFDEDFFLENAQVVLTVPDWMKLEIKEWNFPASGITKTTSQKGNATVYTYNIQNLEARKQNNAAAGPSYLYPHLFIQAQSAQPEGMAAVTYFNTLQDQYNWYHTLAQQIGNDPATFKDKVAELIKDKKTDVEKMEAVYTWVQSNIRYIAFEDGIAGYKPESAQEVYRKKYGDCKGMANLTKEMLKVVGLDSRLCWLGTNHIAYDYSTPSLAVDNHMICAVKLNGKFVYLDATEKYIGFGEYAERIQGRQVLIEDGDKYALERIPTLTMAQNIETQKEILKIDSGKVMGTVALSYRGESKENMLSQLNGIKQQNRDLALAQYLSDNNDDYKIQNLTTSGLQDWNKELSIQYNMQFKNAITEFGDEKYIDLDFNKEFAAFKIDTARKQDYWMPYKFNINNETELTLPNGFTAEIPAPLVISNDTYSFSLQYSITGNKLTYKKQLLILKPVITVKQFNSWNADILKLANFYNEQITLKKS